MTEGNNSSRSTPSNIPTLHAKSSVPSRSLLLLAPFPVHVPAQDAISFFGLVCYSPSAKCLNSLQSRRSLPGGLGFMWQQSQHGTRDMGFSSVHCSIPRFLRFPFSPSLTFSSPIPHGVWGTSVLFVKELSGSRRLSLSLLLPNVS